MADVSGTLDQWSTTASSNGPAGTTVIGTGLDDNLREIQKVVRAGLAFYNSGAVASSGTTDIGAATGNFLDISGTVTITSFGTVAAGIWKVLRFQAALTLTYNATSLILPGAANITTAANDVAIMYSLGSGNWMCASFQPATNAPYEVWDSLFRIVDNGDVAKKVAFQASGITTANTRVLTIADKDITVAGIVDIKGIGSGCRGLGIIPGGTPTTQLSISMDAAELVSSSNYPVVLTAQGPFTLDISTTGLNGRDQVAALTASSQVHIYLITDGTTPGVIASASALPTGPNGASLPVGYTYWCYLTSVVLDASSHFIDGHQYGNTWFYDTSPTVLNAGSATTETSVSCTAYVPAKAMSFGVYGDLSVQNASVASSNLILRLLTTKDIFIETMTVHVGGQTVPGTVSVEIANLNRSFFYLWSSAGVTSRSATLTLPYYRVSNGS